MKSLEDNAGDKTGEHEIRYFRFPYATPEVHLNIEDVDGKNYPTLKDSSGKEIIGVDELYWSPLPTGTLSENLQDCLGEGAKALTGALSFFTSIF